MVPVFWYRFSVPVSGACVIGITAELVLGCILLCLCISLIYKMFSPTSFLLVEVQQDGGAEAAVVRKPSTEQNEKVDGVSGMSY